MGSNMLGQPPVLSVDLLLVFRYSLVLVSYSFVAKLVCSPMGPDKLEPLPVDLRHHLS